ncbi:MAG TPA: amidohydrolase [Lentisphaeria bacterium]|nr:amidohydrolase [Lentisphaeria bacterium]
MMVDAHHHFWNYSTEDYGWISDEMARIRQDFLPDNLAWTLAAAQGYGAISVQARSSIEETEWLLGMFENHAHLRGVVGWLSLAEPEIDEQLERFASHPGLVGVREVLQGMPVETMADAAFNAGVGHLAGHGLTYDLLVIEHQLPPAIDFVDRHPDLPIILDHIAKPLIKDNVLEPWQQNIRELARRPHVSCKLSGLVTEADFHAWTPEQLTPYVETVLEAFGPDRVLFGSDWPVCLVACEYSRWADLVRGWVAPLSDDEQAAILGGNAQRIYNLS